MSPSVSTLLGGRLGYFLFFLLGEGKGSSGRPGGGEVGVLLKIPGGGSGFPGREGCLQKIWGGVYA